MKKSFYLVLQSMLLLLSAIGLGACQSSDEEVVYNPNYNPETGEVNANFVFSISTSNTPTTTRMKADDVQANVTDASKFMGIQNTFLIGYSFKNADNTYADGKIVTEAVPSDKYFDLPSLISAGALQNTGTATGVDKSHRIVELSIPTGINTFTFYGKAPISKTAANGLSPYDQQGKISFAVDPEDIRNNAFSLTPRAAGYATEITATEKVIALVLTRIMQNGMNGTDITNSTATLVTYNGTTYKPKLDWKDYATYDTEKKEWKVKTVSPAKMNTTDPDVPITALEEILGKTFVEFVTVRSGAIRAGSGPSVARVVGDMAVVVGKVALANPTSYQETVAVAMAKRILTRFQNYFRVGLNLSESDEAVYSGVITDGNDCDWQSATNIVAHLLQYAWGNDATNADYLSVNGVLADNMIKKFPTEFEVPMGAAQLLIDPETLVASYNSANNILFTEDQSFDIAKVAFPAEICYFGNSPIRVSDVTKAVSEYPDGAGSGAGQWLNDDSWTGWTPNSHVVTSTRSVAMSKNVNYGTALFETEVGYAEGVTQLLDNNKGLHPDEDPTKIPATAGAFTVTGILIGGQHNTVGWDFLPKAGADANYVVYDKIADALYDGTRTGELPLPAPGSTTATNYTLLWDSYVNQETQNDVYVAIEFYNNSGKDFWGKHNIIRNGGTFYIVGKLSLTKDGLGTDHAIPPYNADGTSKEITRIFIQDFVTRATFRLGETSLQEAYVTVPDLRSTQMSFGLSVDLSWTTGLNFGDIILGQ